LQRRVAQLTGQYAGASRFAIEWLGIA